MEGIVSSDDKVFLKKQKNAIVLIIPDKNQRNEDGTNQVIL